MTRGDRKLRRKPSVSLDKHDILYSRARDVLNQRHVKRPWFNLNPFLERMDEKIDLEEFVPDESKYIQKLESLVLCQSYSCDYPLDTKELTIGNQHLFCVKKGRTFPIYFWKTGKEQHNI